MCAQIFFVTSLLGSGSAPTILARCSEGSGRRRAEKGMVSAQFRRNRARPLKMNKRPGNSQQLQDRLEQSQLSEPSGLNQPNHSFQAYAVRVKEKGANSDADINRVNVKY